MRLSNGKFKNVRGVIGRAKEDRHALARLAGAIDDSVDGRHKLVVGPAA